MSAAEFHRRAMEDALTHAAAQTSTDRRANVLAEAQVHATALLAEGQHTANLIALFDEQGPEVFRDPVVRTDFVDAESYRKALRVAEERVRARYLVLAAEVAERLDLA
jgi:hypothetical protein